MHTIWNGKSRVAVRSLFTLAIFAVLAASPTRAADLVVEGNLTVEEDAQVDGDLAVGAQITAGSGAHVLTNAAGLIDGAKIQSGTMDGSQLTTGAVTEAKLGAGAVTEAKLGAGAVTEAKLGVGAVTGTKLGAGAVTEAKLGAGTVTEAKLATNSVTRAKIGTDAVGMDEIAENCVGPSELHEAGSYTVVALYAVEEQGIGTTTVPHGGVGCAMLALDGPNESTAGPFVQFTTDADNYPVMMLGPYAHDNMGINFDTYFNGAGSSSSDAGSNTRTIKWSDHLTIQRASGVAAGSSIATWIPAIDVDLTNGSVVMPAVYDQTVGATYRTLRIDNTGKIGGLTPSSIRYKENVRDAGEEDTGWIHALRPVMFDYKDHSMGTNQCGLIAEEVAEVHPAIVSYQRELTYVPTGPTEEDPGNFAGASVPVITTTDVPETVNYSDLVVPMLAEIQRLKKQVDTLETRLAALEARE